MSPRYRSMRLFAEGLRKGHKIVRAADHGEDKPDQCSENFPDNDDHVHHQEGAHSDAGILGGDVQILDVQILDVQMRRRRVDFRCADMDMMCGFLMCKSGEF